MGPLFAYLRSLTRRFNTSVLLLHQFNKATQDRKEGPDRVRGSSARFASLDTLIMMDSTKAMDRARLSFAFRKSAPMDSIVVLRDPETLTFSIGEDVRKVKAADVQDTLEVHGPMSSTDLQNMICKTFECSKNTATEAMGETLRVGKVVSNPDPKDRRIEVYEHVKDASR